MLGTNTRILFSFSGVGIGHQGTDFIRFVLSDVNAVGPFYGSNATACNHPDFENDGIQTDPNVAATLGAGGSLVTIPVYQRQAEVTFTTDIAASRPALLCYKFQGETQYQSFGSVPLVYEGMTNDGGHHPYTRLRPENSNASYTMVEAVVIRGLTLRLKPSVLQDMSLGLQLDNGTGHSAALPIRVDQLEPLWKERVVVQFRKEISSAMGIQLFRVGSIHVTMRSRNTVPGYMRPVEVVEEISVAFEVRPEKVNGVIASGSSEIHGVDQITYVLNSLVEKTGSLLYTSNHGGTNGQTETMPLTRHTNQTATLPLTPTTHKVNFFVPSTGNSDMNTLSLPYTNADYGGAFSANGYHPLYSTQNEANQASASQQGDGSSHLHLFNGVNYWMPNGVGYDMGGHDGYLSDMSKLSSSTMLMQHGVSSTSSNPFPSFVVSTRPLATESVFTVSTPLMSIVEGSTTKKERVATAIADASVHAVSFTTTTTSLKIYRKGISEGAWTIKYTIRAGTSGTATAGTNSTTTGILSPATADFISVAAGTVTFAHGEAGPLVIPIDIVTDVAIESAYETFEVVLLDVVASIHATNGVNVGRTASIGPLKRTVVRIYDYGDGHEYVGSSFNSTGGSVEYQRGWSVTNNGAYSPTWVDVNGFYSVDQVFSTLIPHTAESAFASSTASIASNSKTNVFSRPPCPSGVTAGAAIVLDCDLKCDSATSTTTINDAAVVAHVQPTTQTVLGSLGTPITFNGAGHVATENDVELPSRALTATMWLRTSDVSKSGMLLSFVSNTSSTSTSTTTPASSSTYHEFGIYDQRSLRIIVQDSVDGTWRVPALETSISTNDGEWNHLSVSWRSHDGRVTIHRNGVQTFTVLGYRTGALLSERGRIVIGNGALNVELESFASNSGFIGEMQNVRVYRRALEHNDVLDDMRWPFTPRAPEGHLHLVLSYRFTSAYFIGQMNGNGLTLPTVKITNVAENIDANAPLFLDYVDANSDNGWTTYQYNVSNYTGTTSASGVSIGSSTSTGSLSPCAEDSVWYFNAPATYLTPTSSQGNVASLNAAASLADVYDGRLQFEMKAASNSGVLRPRRGMVELYSNAPPYVISNVLPDGFVLPDANGWSAYSIVLREDFGWRTEPDHRDVSHTEMVNMLKTASALRIRGDHWICDANGDGQEAVYINHVRIESPQRKRVDEL